MSSQLFGGSICITELMETLKMGHSAFSKAQNGKVYANILIWQNEDPDKFGNSISVQLSSDKEKRDTEVKVYIGNAKILETRKPVSKKDLPGEDWDTKVLEKNNKNKSQSELSDNSPTVDDLPF
jgi:hypothetical protein